jgi:hypothetical protein
MILNLNTEQVTFGQHYCGLLVHFVRNEEGEPERCERYYSGFLLEAMDTVFWVSAGHVITRINEILSLGYRIESSGFFDLGLKHWQSCSAYFDIDKVVHLDDDVRKVDFALFPLSPIAVQALWNGGTSAIKEANVLRKPADGDVCYLMGNPEEWTKINSKEQTITLCPTILRLDEFEEESHGGFPRFKFDISNNRVTMQGAPLESVVGMSGGPVFAWSGDWKGDYQYGLIGIQSSRLRSKVFVCPAFMVLEVLYLALEEGRKIVEAEQAARAKSDANPPTAS